MENLCCFLAAFLGVFSCLSEAAPRYRHVSTEQRNDHAKDWLVKYGYLHSSVDATIFDQTMALMNMQNFHRLPVTGVLSDEDYNVMQMPRCGFPDMIGEGDAWGGNSTSSKRSRIRRYSINANRDRWDTDIVTYRFLGYTSDLTTTVQEQELTRVAGKWSAASKLTISRAAGTPAAIDISFSQRSHGDNYPFDGPNGVLGHAYFPGEGLGGDIHFDDDEDFTTTAIGTDFSYVALHEMGHSLGLEHSTNPDAVMSTTFVYSSDDLQLHTDDLAGIQSLYEECGENSGPVRLDLSLDGNTSPVPHILAESAKGSASLSESDIDHRFCNPLLSVIAKTRPPEGGTTYQSAEIAPSAEIVCDKVYDAISDVGSSFFFFSGSRLTQANSDFSPINQPISINALIPAGPTRVDAAYVSDSTWLTVFRGNSYWRFNFHTYELDRTISNPAPISDYGVPVSQLDAALYLPGKVYLFSGQLYWEYDTARGTTQGPLTVQAKWSRVTASGASPLTSVFYRQSTDEIYFVSGTTYWAYSSQGEYRRSGNLNTETEELCRWCMSLEPDSGAILLPKLAAILACLILTTVTKHL